ncbi:MAG: hypothetical protein E7266_10860 [Lachnospiraceae bacterium]|nr:hypothetical protein [Lachnospiraceae bacterium]
MGGKVLETEAKNILDAGRREGLREGINIQREKSINNTLDYLNETGVSGDDFILALMKMCDMTKEEAESYLKA